MWANDAEMIDRLAERLVKRLRAPEQHKSTAPAPAPPPFRPEKAPKYETNFEMMQRKARDAVRSGKAISANMLRPKPKPPRAPNQQQQRWSGIHWFWR